MKTNLLIEIAKLIDFEIHPYHVQTDLEAHVIPRALRVPSFHKDYNTITDLVEEYWK